jgi:hypothetical protein
VPQCGDASDGAKTTAAVVPASRLPVPRTTSGVASTSWRIPGATLEGQHRDLEEETILCRDRDTDGIGLGHGEVGAIVLFQRVVEIEGGGPGTVGSLGQGKTLRRIFTRHDLQRDQLVDALAAALVRQDEIGLDRLR